MLCKLAHAKLKCGWFFFLFLFALKKNHAINVWKRQTHTPFSVNFYFLLTTSMNFSILAVKTHDPVERETIGVEFSFLSLPPTPAFLKKLLEVSLAIQQKSLKRMGALNFLMRWFNMLWLRWFATCVGEQSPEVCWKRLEGSDLLWVTLDSPQNTAFCTRGFGDWVRKTLFWFCLCCSGHSLGYWGKPFADLWTSICEIKRLTVLLWDFPSKCMGFLKAHRTRDESQDGAPESCLFVLCKMLPFIKGEQSHYFGYYEIAFPYANSNSWLFYAIAKNYFFLLLTSVMTG